VCFVFCFCRVCSFVRSPGAACCFLPTSSVAPSFTNDAFVSHHVALFWGWADASQTRPIVVEEYSTGHFCEQRTWSSLRGFKPVRRNGWNADPASGSGGSALPPPPPRGSSPRPRPVTPPPVESGSGSGSGTGSSSGACTVTASALNIRSCASTGCRILQVVPSGSSVVPTGEKSGSWDKISSPVSGWVSSVYLSCGGGGFRKEDDTPTSTSPQELNVGLIVGLVVVGLFIVIVAAALAIYFVTRKPQIESV